MKLPLHPQRIPPCNFRPRGVHGVCPGRFLWLRRLNAFGRHRERRLGGGDRRVTGRLHSHGCGYWCPSPGHIWQLRSNEIVQSRAARSSWPGARRVPDDIRRAITTTGFNPRNGPFTLGLILGGIWRHAANTKALSQRPPVRITRMTADLVAAVFDGRLALHHCLDREPAELMGRNRYAANSKGGPHKASSPYITAPQRPRSSPMTCRWPSFAQIRAW